MKSLTFKAECYLRGLNNAVRDDVQDFSTLHTMLDVSSAYEALGIILTGELSHEKIWNRWLDALQKRGVSK